MTPAQEYALGVAMKQRAIRDRQRGPIAQPTPCKTTAQRRRAQIQRDKNARRVLRIMQNNPQLDTIKGILAHIDLPTNDINRALLQLRAELKVKSVGEFPTRWKLA